MTLTYETTADEHETTVKQTYSDGVEVEITVSPGLVEVDEDGEHIFAVDTTFLRFAIERGEVDPDDFDFLYEL